MSNHTPGPLTVDERDGCWAVVDATGRDVVYLDKEPRFYHGEPCGSTTSRGRTPEELKANAIMFASAPDLLAALKGAQGALRKALNAMDGNSGMFDAYDYCGEWLDDINDTISKAEGSEQ